MTTTLTWDILYGDGVVISENQNGQTTSYTYGLERISETIWNAHAAKPRTKWTSEGKNLLVAIL